MSGLTCSWQLNSQFIVIFGSKNWHSFDFRKRSLKSYDYEEGVEFEMTKSHAIWDSEGSVYFVGKAKIDLVLKLRSNSSLLSLPYEMQT